MNSTAAAVIVIIIAALILAVMAGIAGFTLGRALTGAAKIKADESLNETLVVCKKKTVTVCGLLGFQTEQTERYRDIARQAVEALPGDNSRKHPLERKLQEADACLQSKLKEVKG